MELQGTIIAEMDAQIRSEIVEPHRKILARRLLKMGGLDLSAPVPVTWLPDSKVDLEQIHHIASSVDGCKLGSIFLHFACLRRQRHWKSGFPI
jgi:hypothetical protein